MSRSYGAMASAGGSSKGRASGPSIQEEEERSRIANAGSRKALSVAKFGLLIVATGFLALFALTYTKTISSNSDLKLATSTTSSKSSSSSSVDRVVYMDMSDEEQESLFADFITTYGKTYGDDKTSEEYTTRWTYFQSNLALADARNTGEAIMGGDAIHGITKFADLSQDEFESTYLMSAYESDDEYEGTDSRKRRLERRKAAAKGPAFKLFKSSRQVVGKFLRRVLGEDEATVSMVDWSETITTPVNDQGSQCSAASWAFAAAQQIESDAIRKSVLTTSDALSVQQLLSCNTNSTGCVSGSLESTYSYVKKPGAIHSAADYPYNENMDNDAGECTSASSGYATTLGSYATVTKYHNEIEGYSEAQVESNMLAHLVATGTLSACLDASTWNTYVSGSMSGCVGSTINQCVQVVGVYYDPIENTGYYKVRNSWGTNWGEDGFIRLAHGVNSCDIVYNPGYTDPVTCC